MTPSDIVTLKAAIEAAPTMSEATFVAWYPGENQCVPIVHVTVDGAVKLRDGYHVTLSREDVALSSFALVTRLG